MKKLLYLFITGVILSSCASQQSASNLSFVDVTLNYNSDDFEIVELEPITRSAASIMGMTSNDGKSAVLDRSSFNAGSATSFGTGTFILGAISSFTSGLVMMQDAGNYEAAVPVGIGFALLWGAYNDLLWSNAVRNKAIERCNYALLEKYPDVDSFINPKYQISTNKGPLITTCRVTLTAQGVILKNKSSKEVIGNEDSMNTDDQKPKWYYTWVGELNEFASRIKEVAATPAQVSSLEKKDQKKFVTNFKYYYRQYQKISSEVDFDESDLLISGDELKEYYKAYNAIK
jgi:hypothetical protein